MSVERSVARFLSSNVAEFSARVYVGNQNTLALDSLTLPFAVVSVSSSMSDTAYVGDARRAENVSISVEIFCSSYDQRGRLDREIKKKLAAAIAVNEDGLNQPGIDLMMIMELMTTADNLTFQSPQVPFFASPAPVVYRNGTIVAPSEYTVNAALGRIIFAVAQAPTAEIRITAKSGIVDFASCDTMYFNADEETEMRKFCAIQTHTSHFYERTTDQPLY